ncbi:MAG: winged helix-turn-helix domain-containing protein [Pyrinomonadaceae bacterium]|nr:winged helix-turn-helix domain-containing protein [Pyrinomonadaceae bacterium]
MSPKSYQYKFDGFSLLPNEKLLMNGDQILPISGRAFDTLLLLVQNEGKVILKQELLETVWADTFVEEGNLAVAINSLRKALKNDENQKYIETFPKRGYRFNAKVEMVLVKNEFQEESKQSVFLTAANHSVNTDLPVLSIPGSPFKNLYKSVQSYLVSKKWLFLALTIMILLFMGITAVFPSITQGHVIEKGDLESQKTRIAVLPFVDLKPSGDTKNLAISLTDSTIFKLSQTDDFAIISSIPLEKYFQRIPNQEEIKAEVEADFVLSSTFMKNGETIEINSQLFEVKTGKIVMTSKESLTGNGITEIKEKFTKKIMSKIKLYSNVLSAFLNNKE